MADYVDDNVDNRNYDDDKNQEELKDSNELLNRLEKMLREAKGVPFSSNSMVDTEEALMLVGMIKDSLPAELSQAKWLINQSTELLQNARLQADDIVDEAQYQVQQLIDEHEITEQARAYAKETVEEANKTAAQVKRAALQYTEKRLTTVEDQLTEVLVTIRNHKKDLQEEEQQQQ